MLYGTLRALRTPGGARRRLLRRPEAEAAVRGSRIPLLCPTSSSPFILSLTGSTHFSPIYAGPAQQIRPSPLSPVQSSRDDPTQSRRPTSSALPRVRPGTRDLVRPQIRPNHYPHGPTAFCGPAPFHGPALARPVQLQRPTQLARAPGLAFPSAAQLPCFQPSSPAPGPAPVQPVRPPYF
ncbi:hypothetical protein CRG98_011350 [Punica granatum]|uniref:Uncharacterized protein n=1 Tax=Punica granatum TaxID=22663 RepID=A0A2I0KIX0_PUNGR|nr:hypothetical protein CRG98_011350 [Punica granatum]